MGDQVIESGKAGMKKVLVVDNHPLMLKFMSNLLEKHGYEVLTASDGISAIEVMQTAAIDIFFIDLVMPNISGEKLCRIIRSMPGFKDAFLVVMSAIAAEEKLHVEDCQADMVIAKSPFDKMSSHVLRIIKDLEQGRAAELRGKVLGSDEIYEREITKELLASKKHYEITLDHISEGFLELIGNNRIVYANQAVIAILGVSEEELLSTDFITLFSPEDHHRIAECLEMTGGPQQHAALDEPAMVNNKLVEMKFVRVKDDGQDSIVVILSDVTHQKHLEAQLQRAQKMEAVGTLAGGVAHDLNNILSGIVSYPDLLLMQVAEDSDLRGPILTMQESGKKAVTIVQDLLTLARRGVAEIEPVNLNEIIEQYLKSPECHKLRSYHPQVAIRCRLGEDLFNIMGSPVHLSKTVMNLISNAAEAIEHEGSITVETHNCYVDRPINGYETVAEGDYICLRISDSGSGMSSTDLEHIFEPFYTKKKMGRSGTGLGMAVVWGAVRDHHGYIDIKSQTGAGTTVTLYFPATRNIRNAEKVLPIDDYMGNGESVLVIDDVKEQREITSSMLAALGYTVETVSSGEAAVKFLGQQSADLIVLDMIMDPGMDGLDTYRKIIESRAEQKTLIVSGYSETERILEVQKLGAGAFLKKPFTLDKLGQAVKNELKEFNQPPAAAD
ncbi:MAG: response regulator [Desulfobacterales bacterium]|nr:response regulator [Desulfobacterales bacterium]